MLAQIIKKPLLTEKSNLLLSMQQYVFLVAHETTKTQLKFWLEQTFKVKIAHINLLQVLPQAKRARGNTKSGKTSHYKKAIVFLKKDSPKFEFITQN